MGIVVGNINFRVLGRRGSFNRAILHKLRDTYSLLPDLIIEIAIDSRRDIRADRRYTGPPRQDPGRRRHSETCRLRRLHARHHQTAGYPSSRVRSLDPPTGPKHHRTTRTAPLIKLPLANRHHSPSATWRQHRHHFLHSHCLLIPDEPLGNPILQIENLIECTVHLRGPANVPVDALDQPRGDPQLVPYPLIATRHHPAGPQRPPQLCHHCITHCRVAPLPHGSRYLLQPDHYHLVHRFQIRNDCLGDTSPNPGIRRFLRDVRKGHHSHRTGQSRLSGSRLGLRK